MLLGNLVRNELSPVHLLGLSLRPLIVLRVGWGRISPLLEFGFQTFSQELSHFPIYGLWGSSSLGRAARAGVSAEPDPSFVSEASAGRFPDGLK